MWRVGCRRRVVVAGLTTTKVLIVDVVQGSSIHHGCVAVDLPRVVVGRWRREVHRLADGRVLDVVFSEQGLLTSLQFDELLINMLPVSTNLLCIMLSHVEASKEALREKVKNDLLLARGTVPLEEDGPSEEECGSKVDGPPEEEPPTEVGREGACLPNLRRRSMFPLFGCTMSEACQ
jgi:hypothetical protein